MTNTPTKRNGVWMHNEDRCESVARMVAIDAMVALDFDPDDFKMRDCLIVGISKRINDALDAVAAANPS